ncbi:long-chain fatty acid--CoA ligase [Pseudonocardia pini]|uniref:long-chain fatty acid--CoA ligase n=1 Tax=Pseudonocardia pini TaxID=2758030 RepID=UPI001C68929A|nr:long-chain fatty acid--CoA ligase [Pseudonocardia pini]
MITTTMSDVPLSLSRVLRHGARVFGGSECLTRTEDGFARASFREIGANAARLAKALTRLGIGHGDPVGSLSWNTAAHLEAYFGVPGMGAVLHTLNTRLTGRQLSTIVNHAGDRALIVDGTLVDQIVAIQDELPGVEFVIVVGDVPVDALRKPVHRYHELVAAEDPDFEWPEFDERSAASMCYTSGTTGEPKGVVYSHRSLVLHAMSLLSVQAYGPREDDRWLALVPMFHANGWGIPYAAFLSGASLVLPNRFMSAADIVGMVETARPTLAAAVPTLWALVRDHAREHPADLTSLRVGTSGGAAIPRSLLESLEVEQGVRIVQGWGMTETSSLAGMAVPPPGLAPGSPEDLTQRTASGRVLAGVDMRIVDDHGTVLPWDGESVGEIQVRGPSVTAGYHGDVAAEAFDAGWLRTGDVGTVDDRGFFRITDRVKDVIKSGGEWISSVELEDLLLGDPRVAEAAVIGIPDARWTERPLVFVVARDAVDPAELAGRLADSLARWQVPENWAFVSEIPKTAVGKIDKNALRTRFHAGGVDVVRSRAR